MAGNDYQKGKMDISEHQKTWEGFMALSTIGSIVVGALLVFMALVLV